MIEFIVEQFLIIKTFMVVALGWGFGYGFGISLALLIIFKERVRDYFDPPASD